MVALTFNPKTIAYTFTALVMLAVWPAIGHADVVGTQEVLTEQRTTLDREYLIQELSRSEVQQELERYGVDPDQAQQRVAAMTDAEVHELAAGVDQFVVAGDRNVTISLTSALLIILIIALLF